MLKVMSNAGGGEEGQGFDNRVGNYIEKLLKILFFISQLNKNNLFTEI